MDSKIIAYYLPQFHETIENNQWWGKGYTEWRNAKNAKPLFRGHYQPREPYKDNYYDLLDVDVMRKQAQMAEKYGVYGFAFYHYWFGDERKMLEKPAENLLKSKDVNMRFCFAWANENWTRTWEGPGGEKEVLMNQKYGDETDWKAHFDYLKDFFADERYIKKDGKPVLMIYRLDKIPCYKKMFDYWQELAIQAGLPGIYIIQMYYKEEQIRRGIDAYALYVPAVFWGIKRDNVRSEVIQYLQKKLAYKNIPFAIAQFLYDTYDYDKSYEYILSRNYKKNEYMGAFTDFDNTARRGTRAAIWKGVSPKKFCYYLTKIIEKSSKENKEFVFINAWNEWGEGNYLEPDKKYGFGYLKAIKIACNKSKKGDAR